jgi:uncharacterized membrane protein YfcA
VLVWLQPHYYAIAPFIGILAGFIGTLLGIGGGSVMVPVLVLLGVNVKIAVPASLLAILGTSLGGLRTLFKRGLVDYRLAVLLESASITGATIGVVAFGRMSSYFLTGLLAAVLILSGGLFIIRERLGGPGRKVSSLREYGVIRLSLAWIASLVAGFFSATLGIGGGVLKVPVLVLIVGLAIHVAVSTSKLMVGITALTSVVGHALTGRMDYLLGTLLLVGTYIGASLSTKVLISLKPRTLMIIASSYYIIMGIALFSKLFY